MVSLLLPFPATFEQIAQKFVGNYCVIRVPVSRSVFYLFLTKCVILLFNGIEHPVKYGLLRVSTV